MSAVRLEVVGQEKLERAAKLLAGVEGGLKKAVREAMSRGVSHLRSHSAQAIRERYAISASNIRTNENIQVRYSYQDGVQATVTFAGKRIPLYRFDGTTPAHFTQDTSHRNRAKTRDGWRMAYPSPPAAAHQLKDTSPKRFNDAFVATMKSSNHTGIFERTGGQTSNDRERLEELMGSSVPQMLGSPEVEKKLTEEAMEKVEERLEHNVTAIISGYWG